MSDALIYLFFVAAPLSLIAWMAFIRGTSRFGLLIRGLLVAGFLFFFTRAGAGWVLLSLELPRLYWLLLVVAVLVANVRHRALHWWPPKKAGPWVSIVATAIPASIFIAASIATLGAEDYEGDGVELQFPLGGGNWAVMHGGANAWLNHHSEVKGQRYALDVVAIDGMSRRADGLAPTTKESYFIFDAPVHSPCAGKVLAAESELPDLDPPQRDPDHLAGNYLLIHCTDEDVTVLLAHLRQGSLKVRKGKKVKRGNEVGNVGNSGNTTEPHLHFHAVRGAVDDVDAATSSAEPAPMLFAGRFLVRNDKLVVRTGAPTR
jgi:hypothetical protein